MPNKEMQTDAKKKRAADFRVIWQGSIQILNYKTCNAFKIVKGRLAIEFKRGNLEAN